MDKRVGIVLCVALGVATGAWAQKAGDNIVGLGLASIHPRLSLDPLTSSGPLAVPFNAATAGASGDISSETTLSLGWLHLFTDHVGAEFTIGVPRRHTIDLRTPSPFALSPQHPGAATIKPWTPTAVAKYLFGPPDSAWRPYLGLGLSYVSFHAFDVNRADPIVVQIAGQSADMDSAWTPVWNAGLIYRFNERWSLNGSVSYLPIRTSATFVGTAGTTTRGDVKLHTTDYVIRLGYRF